MSAEVLYDPYEVSNPVGESIISWTVYRNYSVSILNKVVSSDLVKHSMVDFDVILGMN